MESSSCIRAPPPGAAPLGGGFLFRNQLGGMRYGEAIVRDGTSLCANVPAELNGSRLTLTVRAKLRARK
jgi:hypothetical protein